MEPIAEAIQQLQKKFGMAEPTTETPSGEPVCVLCKKADWTVAESGKSICHSCGDLITQAQDFRALHFIVPSRYRPALSKLSLSAGQGLLFIGPAGTGKTWESYGLLRRLANEDRRLKLAAYSWPAVLLMLRRGYSRPDFAAIADEVIEALRQADITFLDDLGSEKVTDINLAWLQENLYGILDHRWNWQLSTILTTNLPLERLPDYLGPRIASRVLGMCEIVPLSGKDRRLSEET